MLDDNFIKNDTIKVILSDGTEILMDYSDSEIHDGPVSAQNLTIAAQKTFGVIKSLAKDIKAQIQAAAPNKASVEFSIELEKKSGDILSKICNASGKSGIKITLEWNFSKDNSK